MAGPAHWGTQPQTRIAEAKEMARQAVKQGSPKGLTALGKAYYEVFTNDLSNKGKHSSQHAEAVPQDKDGRDIQLERASGDVRLHQSNECPWHRPFLYGRPAHHGMERGSDSRRTNATPR